MIIEIEDGENEFGRWTHGMSARRSRGASISTKEQPEVVPPIIINKNNC